MSQKLVICSKPENIDVLCDVSVVSGHEFQSCFDLEGNYYEHDLTTDKWYMLT